MNPVDALNKTVYLRLQPSPVHGIGVFAMRDIPSGQELYSLPPQKHFRLSLDDFAQVLPEIQRLILDQWLQLAPNVVLFCHPNLVNFRSFFNHSSTPNTDGVKAVRNIAKEEEITEDYTSFGELVPISLKHYAEFIKK